MRFNNQCRHEKTEYVAGEVQQKVTVLFRRNNKGQELEGGYTAPSPQQQTKCLPRLERRNCILLDEEHALSQCLSVNTQWSLSDHSVIN